MARWRFKEKSDKIIPTKNLLQRLGLEWIVFRITSIKRYLLIMIC